MSRRRVLIAGAGVAALETMLALQDHAGDRVEIDLLAPTRDFVYRPLTVLEPFGGDEAPRLSLGKVLREHGVGHVHDALAAVDPKKRTIRTTSDDEYPYEDVVVAIGALPIEAVPGALTFPDALGVDRFRALLEELDRGDVGSVAFVVPDAASWALPLYELALLTAQHVPEGSVRLALVTPEKAPLTAFGDKAGPAVEELLRQHSIEMHVGVAPKAAGPEGLTLDRGDVLPADRVVALPRLVGPGVAGLPTDEQGFLPVDERGRVRGVDGVYAAGDAASWPLKQGGLAAQQADVVAEWIAESVGAPVRPGSYRPVLRGVLLTGDAPAFLRADARGDRQRSIARLEPLWWPPAKVAGRYLAPYLAAHGISMGQQPAEP